MNAVKGNQINWIQKVPEKWSVKKLKFLGSLSSSGVDKKIVDGEPLFKSVHYMNVYNNSLCEIANSDEYLVISANENQANNCTLKKHDVLFTNSSETPEDMGHSSVIKEDLENTLYGYHLMRFRPSEKFELNYLKYLFGSYYMRKWFEYRSTGMTRYGVSYADFAQARILYPPLPEQTAIAAYLDDKCGKIDSICDKTRNQIEKLKAYKQSVITEAVTKGLDKSAKMKDSGVEWIGEIPEGWEVRRIKFVASMRSGETITSDFIDATGEYPVFGGNGLRGYTDNKTHNGEYILIGRQGALCGNVKFVSGEFWASEHAIVVTPNSNIVKKWLCQTLHSMNLNQYSTSAAQPGLSVEQILKLWIPLPDEDNQTSIAAYLDDKCAKIDNAIEKKKQLIEKLETYKKSLIFEAVTGKKEIAN